MAAGDVTRIEYQRATDPETGVEVTRLTDDEGDSIFPYFTQPVFASAEDALLVSSNRTGKWQAYVLWVSEGRLVQLTDEPNGIRHHSSSVLPTQSAIVYFAGRVLKRVGLDGSGARELYEAPPGFRPSVASPTSDGTAVCFAYSEEVSQSTQTGRIYSGMLETLFRRPCSVVMRVDTSTGEARALWGEREWINHVNVSPADPDIVVFCHEGPWHLVQRLWVVRASTHEVWPRLRQRRYLDRSGHEYFTASGRLVTQWSSRQSPSGGDTVCWNAVVNPDGSDLRMYRYPRGQPCHIQTNAAEDLIVGDSCYTEDGPQFGREWMCLVRHEGEHALVRPLCHHGTSWRTQHSHPHPVFTPDDEHVVFNSDRGGRSNVYMAPARWD
ncbi:MAG: oligogalacturonate lyase family protein [Armatimonadota bacterium]